MTHNKTDQTNSNPQIGILMGSTSDAEIMQRAGNILEQLGISYEILVRSAHRTVDESIEYARQARNRGIKVIIAGAGMAAHLAGVVAACTTLPVIGVPLSSGPLQGQDALYATVQMPKGTPVATVGINNSVNAAYLAAKILAVNDQDLTLKLEAVREEKRKEILDSRL